MSTSNAKEFFYKYIYENEAREDELRQTANDDEFTQKIIDLAQSECWPTGEFDASDLEQAGNEHAFSRPEIYAKYESIINLLRQFKIGGKTRVY
jgi:hypothetical protein